MVDDGAGVGYPDGASTTHSGSFNSIQGFSEVTLGLAANDSSANFKGFIYWMKSSTATSVIAKKRSVEIPQT